MKIILLGYMGSGKSGVGGELATKLGFPFLDLDQEIIQRDEREIPQIFAESGEIFFRKKESEVLENTLNSGPSDFILSTGGGTPCYGNNLQLMKSYPDTVLVYLKTSLEELTRRLFPERNFRPLISHLDTEELLNDFIRKHLFERAYHYGQSDLVINTDDRTIGEIAEEITRQLKLQGVGEKK